MNELVIYYSRSLLYGMVMGAIITYIFALSFAYKKVESRNGHFVLGLSIWGMAWMFLQYLIWFFVDTYDLLDLPLLSGVINFIEMSSLVLYGLTIYSITKLKPLKKLKMLLVFSPLILCTLLYVMTDDSVFIWAGYIIMAVLCVLACVLISRNIKRYHELLNKTYANTSSRGLKWIFSILYPSFLIVVAWIVLGAMSPSSLNDCIYMCSSIILLGVFTQRLCRQNFDIRIMEEIAENPEEEIAEDAEEEIAEEKDAEVDKPQQELPQEQPVETADEDIEVAQPQLPHVAVKLKAWQEPKFAQAIEAFCNDEKNYTNSDLSVQDVATGVGTNRTYVSRWFKEQNTDFSSYIINIRLTYAEKLLVTTNMPILEIVDMSGFCNPRHFRTSFAARFGCPPSEYRAAKQS